MNETSTFKSLIEAQHYYNIANHAQFIKKKENKYIIPTYMDTISQGKYIPVIMNIIININNHHHDKFI